MTKKFEDWRKLRPSNSLWYRSWIVGLLLYVLYMHSTFFVERQTMWAQWQRSWKDSYLKTKQEVLQTCKSRDRLTCLEQLLQLEGVREDGIR